jgi:hypothetical protein
MVNPSCLLNLVLAIALLTGVDMRPAERNPVLIPKTGRIGKDSAMSTTEVNVDQWLEFMGTNHLDGSTFPADSALPGRWHSILFTDLKKRDHFEHLVRTSEGRFHFRRDSLFYALAKTHESDPGNSPITGITYEQALRFCEWKEAEVNKNRPPGKRIKIALPSIDLYRRLIPNIDSVAAVRKVNLPCRGFEFNYKHAPCEVPAKGSESLQGLTVMRVDSYWPTDLGLYCMQGNVAEMTATKGVAMGGSYRHYAYQSHSDQLQPYSGPAEWLGFRFIVTLNVYDQ